jgi:hypothetical protein
MSVEAQKTSTPPQSFPSLRPGRPHSVCGAILLVFLAVNAGRADPVELSRQVITLPANAGAPLFVDIEGNGRCNLLVIDTVEKKLLNYRQRPSGFTN